MFPAGLFFLLSASLSGSAAVTRVPCRPRVLKCYHIKNWGSACQHRPPFNNLKYAAIHMDVVHPISDGKKTPWRRNHNHQRGHAAKKHCTGLRLVPGHQWDTGSCCRHLSEEVREVVSMLGKELFYNDKINCTLTQVFLKLKGYL